MNNKPVKYIFVTGGVLSGLGKGITAASIANLLKARGLKVNLQKCDPYLNVDAGTLNPREHGECFVTKDGAETDLDLGHYERFIDEEMTRDSSVMAGRILLKVIQDERAGKYEGDDVQIIPHLTAAIQEYFISASKGYEVQIIEIGGTVGDYESLSFVEAIREFGIKFGKENVIYVHVVYLPYLNASNEIKTKPAQNSVRELRGLGIVPDILVARSELKSDKKIKDKLSLFAGVSKEEIALLPNAATIYEVPLTLENAGITDVVMKKLKLKIVKPDLKNWENMVKKAKTNFSRTISVAMIAKYLDNSDTYLSVLEALKSAAWNNNVNIKIDWIDASLFDSSDQNQFKELQKKLIKYQGIVVPGGFGTRGLEGKIKAAEIALDRKIPYLGLCLGLQMAVIAAARKSGFKDATTFELSDDKSKQIIVTMKDQADKIMTGGTMRLGNYDCEIEKNTLAYNVYKKSNIVERHRHRGECNNKFVDKYNDWGIRISGFNRENGLVEIVEAINHPFFIASQFHPEFKSRPNRPHPMFDGFVKSIKS